MKITYLDFVSKIPLSLFCNLMFIPHTCIPGRASRHPSNDDVFSNSDDAHTSTTINDASKWKGVTVENNRKGKKRHGKWASLDFC
jgi:hypothetical protein